MLPPMPLPSLVKSKPWVTEEECNIKMSTCNDSMENTRELMEHINNYPIANQPISDSTLKDMFISLCSTIHAVMLECMRSFKSDISELGGRMNHVEEKCWNLPTPTISYWMPTMIKQRRLPSSWLRWRTWRTGRAGTIIKLGGSLKPHNLHTFNNMPATS